MGEIVFFFEPELLQLNCCVKQRLNGQCVLRLKIICFISYISRNFWLMTNSILSAPEHWSAGDDLKLAVSPADFYSLSEKNGLIYEITRIVIHTIIQQLVQWRKEGLKLLPIAFNCSTRSLHEPDLADFVLSLMRENSLPFELLQIEIAENGITG